MLNLRAIKFRAFNTESKRMFQWEELVEFWTLEDIERINCGNSKTILLQFTGLSDKNGKEIYEGDILSDKYKVQVCQNDEGTFIVRFRNPKVNTMPLKQYLKKRGKAGCEERDCIIIGNIYETPELLEV